MSPAFCFTTAISFGSLFLGCFIAGKWRAFAFWTALALVGQAAALQWINAGRLIHFQHYWSLNELLNEHLGSVLIVSVQFLFVAAAIGKHFRQIKSWIDTVLGRWKLVLIFGFISCAGAAVTPDYSIYTRSLLIAFLFQTLSLGNIIVVAFSIPEESIGRLRQEFNRLLGTADEGAKPIIDRFAVVAAVWVFIFTGILSLFVYQSHPHVPDETQYIFQAKYMAAGQLTTKPPLVTEAFAIYMVPYKDARWYGIFPPAFPLVLAIGLKLGAVGIVNPFLAGLCVLLAYLFFQELYSQRFARIAILLLCLSPWFLFMAMSLMSHIFTLFCALSAVLLLQSAIKKDSVLFAASSGLFIGVLNLVRPLDGLIVALLLGLMALFCCRNWKRRLVTTVALVIGTISATAFVLPYNKLVTGNAFVLPSTAFYDKYFWKGAMSLGFGPERGMGWGLDAYPGHSPFEALINGALNVFLLNIELFGWGISSLALVIYFAVSGGISKKDAWAVVLIVAVVGCYSLFWYHGGPDFGARYWFICVIPLVALSVRGIQWLSYNIGNSTKAKSSVNPRLVLALFVMGGISMLTFVPWRIADKYYHYLDMQPGIIQLAQQNRFGRSLVLIRGSEHPDYQSAWIYNPVNFEGEGPIYAWDKNADIRRQLLKKYGDRTVWIVNGPTLADGKYQVVTGPTRAADLLKAADK